ncbi:hypothetical protein [Erythrobacter sp.]|uniref:hypothetical protein n=1 Tax=Erythrobacter sp. TaxID=1042 RepID=UPI001425DD4F|nr:hypothetical protein [Erythrobacter sp.]QIQ87955.1 MAG: hypothetical protein G9473_15575 [Erythrobacter sp.]
MEAEDNQTENAYANTIVFRAPTFDQWLRHKDRSDFECPIFSDSGEFWAAALDSIDDLLGLMLNHGMTAEITVRRSL